MLPSLIFGGTGLDSAPDHVLNDNTVLMANLAAAETTLSLIHIYPGNNVPGFCRGDNRI